MRTSIAKRTRLISLSVVISASNSCCASSSSMGDVFRTAASDSSCALCCHCSSLQRIVQLLISTLIAEVCSLVMPIDFWYLTSVSGERNCWEKMSIWLLDERDILLLLNPPGQSGGGE